MSRRRQHAVAPLDSGENVAVGSHGDVAHRTQVWTRRARRRIPSGSVRPLVRVQEVAQRRAAGTECGARPARPERRPRGNQREQRRIGDQAHKIGVFRGKIAQSERPRSRGKNAIFPLATGKRCLTLGADGAAGLACDRPCSLSTEALDGHEEEGSEEEDQKKSKRKPNAAFMRR